MPPTLSFSKIKHLYYDKHGYKHKNTYAKGTYMHKIIEDKYMAKKGMRREVYVSKVINGVIIKGIIDLMDRDTIYEIKPLQYYYNERELVRLQVALYSLLYPNKRVIYILYDYNGYKEVYEDENLSLYKDILMNIIKEYSIFNKNINNQSINQSI